MLMFIIILASLSLYNLLLAFPGYTEFLKLYIDVSCLLNTFFTNLLNWTL